MEKFLSDYIKNPQIITPDDEYHYFFGYYDMPYFALEATVIYTAITHPISSI